MLNNNEAKLLEQFINGKINDNEINDLILTGKFTKDNLENIISYINTLKNTNN